MNAFLNVWVYFCAKNRKTALMRLLRACAEPDNRKQWTAAARKSRKNNPGKISEKNNRKNIREKIMRKINPGSVSGKIFREDIRDSGRKISPAETEDISHHRQDIEAE